MEKGHQTESLYGGEIEASKYAMKKFNSWATQWVEEYLYQYSFPDQNRINQFLETRGFNYENYYDLFFPMVRKKYTKIIYNSAIHRFKYCYKFIKGLSCLGDRETSGDVIGVYNLSITKKYHILYGMYNTIKIAYDEKVITEQVFMHFLGKYDELIKMDTDSNINYHKDIIEKIRLEFSSLTQLSSNTGGMING